MSFGRALALPLASVLIWQGRRVRRDTPKLPEAEGPREGIDDTHTFDNSDKPGEPLRLLILGDSSAAGVGASTQSEALSGQLRACLASTLTVPLHWRVVARTGIATGEALALLDEDMPDQPAAFDIALVALGVNDVTALRGVSRWLADVDRVCARLCERHSVKRVIWSGLPPMHRFPALPQPLRMVMGLHARAFDRALAVHFSRDDSVGERRHIAMPPMPDGAVASDGFHPGPLAYARWAQTLHSALDQNKKPA
jgi:lysophospholipase L1-like esterase